MVPAWMWLLCLSVPQALAEAQLAELYVEVPENYGGNFPLYLTKVSLSAGVGYAPPESFLPYLQYSFLFLLWLTFKHCYPENKCYSMYDWQDFNPRRK